MSEPLEFLQNTSTRQFLRTTVQGLAPSLVLSVACTLIVYALLSPHFPPTSLIPLLIASLCPVLGNIVSLIRSRRLDIFGLLVFMGIIVSVIGVMLGGGPQLLLIRESFVTGALGLAFLVSLLLPKSLGYYFARQFLTGNDPENTGGFATLWRYPSFRHGIQGGTIFWGLLLVGEFIVRVLLVLSLPTLLVLTISPIVFNILIVVGIVVSTIWGRKIVLQVSELRRAAQPVVAANTNVELPEDQGSVSADR